MKKIDYRLRAPSLPHDIRRTAKARRPKVTKRNDSGAVAPAELLRKIWDGMEKSDEVRDLSSYTLFEWDKEKVKVRAGDT
jgi:hypothetical protein